jgi:hypothetical protein
VLRFLFVLVLLAVAIYLLVRVFQERSAAGGTGRGLGAPRRPQGPRRPQRPRIVAPDDDEDFLRDLDRKRRNPEDPDA